MPGTLVRTDFCAVSFQKAWPLDRTEDCAVHLLGVPATKFAQLIEHEGVLRCLLLLRNSLFPVRREKLVPAGNKLGASGE